MKICILTPRFPFPVNGGDLIRISNIAKYLKSRGHELVLVSLYDQVLTDDAIHEVNRYFNKYYAVKRNHLVSVFYSALYMLKGLPIQCGYFYSRKYKNVLAKVFDEEQPDMIVCHLLRMCPYIEQFSMEHKTIVEMTDALSRMYQNSRGAKGAIIKRIVYSLETYSLKKYEQKTIQKYPKVVLVSQLDIDYLESGSAPMKKSPLALHPNGVFLADKPNTTIYNPHKICFVGNMRTLQNQDAAIYFVSKVFPLILQNEPNAEFHIIGAQPSNQIKKLTRSKNVFVTGYVEDLSSYISDACISVAPVRLASGIQNKVLISLSYGIPVVLTSTIAKAIPELANSQNCFICDEAEEFAKTCLKVMKSKDLRQSLSKHGRDMVKQHYSWDVKLEGYEQV